MFRATEGKGKYRDAAVKVIDKGGSHAKREIKNYVTINDARKKNKYIARHFPEVYDIFETDDHAVIVMELLDPTSAGMSVVGDFLQGPEAIYRVGRPDKSMKDIDKMYKDAYGQDAGLMKTDITGRVKNMMLDAKTFSKLMEEFLKNFSLDINTQDLNDMKMSKDIVWSPKHIPEEYIRWVGYSPETFFDVNCLQLDEKHLMVTRYNKQVFDFLKKHKVEPIIIPFRHRYLWDGGLHCMTFDYERE